MSSEIWFPNCTREKIKTIDALIKSGETVKDVAELFGHAQSTLGRWHRAYQRYGEMRFAHDETKALRSGDLRTKQQRRAAREALKSAAGITGHG